MHILALAVDPTPQGPVVRFLQHPGALLSEPWRWFMEAAASTWPVALPSLAAAVSLAVGTQLALRQRRHRIMADGARLITVEVPAEVGADAAAKFWSHLHALLRPTWRRFVEGQPHLSFEYFFDSVAALIHVWVPGAVAPGMVESAIQSAWPGARTTVLSPAPDPMPSTATTATGGWLRLARSEALPLMAKHDSDPLRPLLGAGSTLQPGEFAVVQVLARPATGRRLHTMRRRINRLRRHAVGMRRSTPRTVVASTLDELTSGATSVPIRHALLHDPVAAAELRAAIAKTTGSLWETEVRYAVAASGDANPQRLRGVAGSLAAAFGVFAERNWWARKPLRQPVKAAARRRFASGDLLNITELASLAHLPTDAFALGVTRAGARSIAPAPTVPSDDSMKVLGDADAGPARPVGLKVADARRHTHILGSTGSGKSTLMGRMILDDIAVGRGVVVIDPKGDLIADVLDRLPENVGHRTILIDPTAEGPHPTLNILGPAGNANDRELLAENLVGIFRRTFAAHWGPRTDDVLRTAILTLQVTAQSKVLAKVKTPTLTDIPDLLTNDAIRRRVLSRLPEDEKVLRGFWTAYENLSEAGRSAMTAPLLNKLRAFLLRDFVQATISDATSTVDLQQVLDGGILLVRLPKGVLGEEAARLLGSFIVAATWHAASARAKSCEGARNDASLLLDEAHNFLAMPIPMEDMLAEARAYRLSLVLAHQNLAQMPTDLREGISANALNKVFFACSPEDARALMHHTAPVLTEHDLSHLGSYQAAVRLSVDGVTVPAFTMCTRPLPPAIPGRAARIRELSAATTTARRNAIAHGSDSREHQTAA